MHAHTHTHTPCNHSLITANHLQITAAPLLVIVGSPPITGKSLRIPPRNVRHVKILVIYGARLSTARLFFSFALPIVLLSTPWAAGNRARKKETVGGEPRRGDRCSPF